jgi:hypothetical protein
MSELRVKPINRGVRAMRKADGFFFNRFKAQYKARPTIAKTLATHFNLTPQIITDIVQQYVQKVLDSLPEVKSASIANLINIKLDTKLAYQALSVGGDKKKQKKYRIPKLTLAFAPTRAANKNLEAAAIKYCIDKLPATDAFELLNSLA